MKRARHFLLPAVLYGAVTLQSSFALRGPPAPFPGADKVLHLIAYGVLAFAVARALAKGFPGALGPMATVVVVTLAVGLLGLVDELHQSFVPGRNADPADAVADVAGGPLGAALWLALERFRGGSNEGPHSK